MARSARQGAWGCFEPKRFGLALPCASGAGRAASATVTRASARGATWWSAIDTTAVPSPTALNSARRQRDGRWRRGRPIAASSASRNAAADE
jgi:hypothetical protein